MITLNTLSDLIKNHGRMTHYLNEEGGAWIKPSTQLPVLAYCHAFRFEDGAIWDEINGIRPQDQWYDPDAPQKDLRR